ncbi:uncharacterized protein AKAW2_10958A [Aspergillus luchuensis]|uniref:Endo-polygalacturonase D n=1 Tax=Aspergillus kawachii TaxID=1069201 RepID=A0A146FDA6_ASPKA|nr:uncharacterized protein AKAW2_10958A [Aspergillus luchuensis]BCR93912.1 hypothetical protein AKAW2_10958A [Aspergillus luchuensis]GAT23847.1 endo-polygalacturonase D [Aspergillus luchuensis]
MFDDGLASQNKTTPWCCQAWYRKLRGTDALHSGADLQNRSKYHTTVAVTRKGSYWISGVAVSVRGLHGWMVGWIDWQGSGPMGGQERPTHRIKGPKKQKKGGKKQPAEQSLFCSYYAISRSASVKFLHGGKEGGNSKPATASEDVSLSQTQNHCLLPPACRLTPSSILGAAALKNSNAKGYTHTKRQVRIVESTSLSSIPGSPCFSCSLAPKPECSMVGGGDGSGVSSIEQPWKLLKKSQSLVP